MTDSTIRQEVQALAGNLGSAWNGGGFVLDRVNLAAGEVGGNPWRSLSRLDDARLEGLFSDPDRRSELGAAFQKLTRYLTAETWFDRAVRDSDRLAALRHGPVAYFCAEFGLAAWLPIYSGGLGILAGDVLKESSDMGLPFVGIGLFYRHGFFFQRMNAECYQTEIYPTLDVSDFPMAPAAGLNGKNLLVPVPLGTHIIYAQVWQLRVGRTMLYLLDTDIPENERAEDRAITANLYGGDQQTRVRQEIVLGIGGVRAMRALGIQPSLYSMNEGHAAFLGVELLAEMLPSHDFTSALTGVRQRTVYTNHTVVPAGNDVFPRDLVREYVGPYAEQRGLGVERFLGLGTRGVGDTFSMAELAFHMSGRANAVSELHAQIVPREWPGYSVEAVTNGVHAPSWVGTAVSPLLDRYVPDWRSDNPDWSKLQSVPAADLWSARERQRGLLVDFVNERQSEARLDPAALTLVWARRFAEYKRAWLLTSDVARLVRLLSDANHPVQIIVAGKAHPRDDTGKRVLQDLLRCIHAEAAVGMRMAFIEDYDERVARYLVGGADVWVNTPRKPLEASGTSGMKSGDNGGLQLTVTDGWAAEVNWYDVGWGIEGRDDGQDANDLYTYLENSIIPTFYERDASGIPQRWIAMVKRSMEVTLSRYSARRMMLDYVNKLYLPLLEEQGAVSGSAGH
ncbi:MAG: glycosyltransferase family 1 protein [Chloroflexota bacterium]